MSGAVAAEETTSGALASGASSLVPAATELTSTEPAPPERGAALLETGMEAEACGGCIGGLDPIPEAGSCEWEGATSSWVLLPWTAEAAALLLLLLVSWELVAAAARLRQGCAETVEATPRAETERRRSRASEVLRAPPPREARRC